MVQVTMEVGRLRTFVDGRWAAIREEVRAQIRASDLLRPVGGLSIEDYRARVLEQARMVSETKSARLFFPREYGGEGDMGGALTAFETIALVDLSLLVKVGVQYGLFGGVIRRLGTERHHQRYLRAAMTMELPGCFAMTETGHGSDVQSIRTTATYDASREAFLIHTPDDDARKDYIGNAARDGRMAAVFAQLITGGEGRGVHVFLVPIRDERGRSCPGVRIEDCGLKGGLNGVDNGRLWFDQVRVPRDALLDRFGTVARDGAYSSPIANETRRFFTMLGTLVSGRVSVAGAGLSATKLAMTIAIRYGLVRRQFRAAGSDQEVIILDTCNISGGSFQPWPRLTRCTLPSRGWSSRSTRRRTVTVRTSRNNVSSRRWRRASRRSRPGTPRRPSRRAARRVAARDTCPSTA